MKLPATRNTTLSADEDRIDAARERALADKSTLNGQFRLALARCAQALKARQVDHTLAAWRGRLTVGRKLSREEVTER